MMSGRIKKFSKIMSAVLLALGMFGVDLVTPAQAQFFGFLGQHTLPWQHSEIGRGAVSAIVDQRGMHLVRPAHRNGNVYVADTVNHYGQTFRLIIDASNGRVLEMFKTGHVAVAQHQRPQRHLRAVQARVHLQHVTHSRSATTKRKSKRKTRSKADIPVEAAMPAPASRTTNVSRTTTVSQAPSVAMPRPVAQPATAAIAPAAAKVASPNVIAPQARPAPASLKSKINDVPVVPLD